MAGTKADARQFARRWAHKGNEEQDKHLYWIGLFQDVLGLPDALDRLKFEHQVHTKASEHQGFIDVLIPTASAIVEQKGVTHDLAKAELRQGRMVTPAQQALAYTEGLPLSQKPRYVIACNFAELWIYDTERDPLCKGEPLVVRLADLPKNLPAIQFLAARGEAPSSVQRAVSIEAGRIMGQIHEDVAASFEAAGFARDDEATHHAISAFCCRVMFLMFCEDEAGLIPPNAFRDYVRHFPAEDLREALLRLFEWLNTPDAERDPFASDLLRAFPYMDGGLFAERTQIPRLSETLRTRIIVEGCQEFDWSEVNPTVFGSIFEGSLSHDQRRAGGMHYTDPANIHKVIDPLFLDALEEEFAWACVRSEAGGARTKALEDLHDKLGRIAVLDPACGSGNFLTESYQCLRRLENRILIELRKDGQASLSFEDQGYAEVRVSLANFCGIEVNDFACAVARTALWIAEKQADADTASIVHRVYQALPLTDYGTIHHGNALRMSWEEVLPAERCSYVCGNPPFIGYSNLTTEQKADRASIFGRTGGTLDYVSCWHRKTADYMAGHPIRAALVSTNSICQGQQVEPLWRPLFDEGIHIDFAHRTFVWNSQADDVAHVHCVIVGFSQQEVAPRLLFEGDERREVEHINGYLAAAPDAFVVRRRLPLCEGVPQMRAGGKPTDGGYLLLSPEERDELVAKEPAAAAWIRPFSMGAEFINGQDRYCLWLEGITPKQLKAMPAVMRRVQAVREFRLTSAKAATRKKAETPWLFDEVRRVGKSYIAVPAVSSGRRVYVPMGFVTNGMVPGNQLYYIPDGTLYEFGILMSQVHNAWMRVVAGRLKSDYRYTNTIVYNNFVWPDPTPEQRLCIESCAQAVLDSRAAYPGSSLADLYDPGDAWLYPKLAAAHEALDAAVEAAYGQDFAGDEERIVAHLFRLYAQRTRQG